MPDQEPVKDDHEVDSDSFADAEVDKEDSHDATSDFTDWGGGDLEAAYLKAMSALEASDWEVRDGGEDPPVADAAVHQPVQQAETNSPAGAETSSDVNAPRPVADQVAALVDLFPNPASIQSPESEAGKATVAETRMTPRQIIEACLFVGGGGTDFIETVWRLAW